MDPISAGVGAAGSIFSSIFGAVGAAKQRELQRQAAELAQKGADELKGGTGYDPNSALAFLGLNDKSAYEDQDPVARQQSMEALNQLVNRGKGSDLDIQSKQALSEGIARSGGAQNAARRAIIQEYANKGGDSGSQLGAMLQSQQANYGDLAGATGAASAAAEQRRLEANVLASRAGQGQQGIDQAKSAAIDALRRFNVGAKQGTLGLEREYRQGAAGVYDSAGKTMAGIATNAGKPYTSVGEFGNNLLEAGKGVYNSFAGNNAPSAGPGTDWSAQPASPNLGNWSTQLQAPEKLKLDTGKAW
jgi:hypothetical protein